MRCSCGYLHRSLEQGRQRAGEVGPGRARVAELCAADWGLWRTITANVEKVLEHAGDYDVPAEDRERIAARLRAVLERIEAEPKSRAWRLRAKIGERKRWYEVPEEPRH